MFPLRNDVHQRQPQAVTRRSLYQALICCVIVKVSKLAVVPSVIFCLATASSHIARTSSPSNRTLAPALAQLFVCCKLVTRAHNPHRPSPESHARSGTRPPSPRFHSARARTVNAVPFLASSTRSPHRASILRHPRRQQQRAFRQQTKNGQCFIECPNRYFPFAIVGGAVARLPSLGQSLSRRSGVSV